MPSPGASRPRRAATRSRPIITFCHPQRWGSWNAAKRLTELHYTHVYWYPGGSEGWAAQGALKAVAEDRQWQAGGFDKSSAGDMPDAGVRARGVEGEVGRRLA